MGTDTNEHMGGTISNSVRAATTDISVLLQERDQLRDSNKVLEAKLAAERESVNELSLANQALVLNISVLVKTIEAAIKAVKVTP